LKAAIRSEGSLRRMKDGETGEEAIIYSGCLLTVGQWFLPWSCCNGTCYARRRAGSDAGTFCCGAAPGYSQGGWFAVLFSPPLQLIWFISCIFDVIAVSVSSPPTYQFYLSPSPAAKAPPGLEAGSRWNQIGAHFSHPKGGAIDVAGPAARCGCLNWRDFDQLVA
jgi:hypothetical protein